MSYNLTAGDGRWLAVDQSVNRQPGSACSGLQLIRDQHRPSWSLWLAATATSAVHTLAAECGEGCYHEAIRALGPRLDSCVESAVVALPSPEQDDIGGAQIDLIGGFWLVTGEEP